MYSLPNLDWIVGRLSGTEFGQRSTLPRWVWMDFDDRGVSHSRVARLLVNGFLCPSSPTVCLTDDVSILVDTVFASSSLQESLWALKPNHIRFFP